MYGIWSAVTESSSPSRASYSTGLFLPHFLELLSDPKRWNINKTLIQESTINGHNPLIMSIFPRKSSADEKPFIAYNHCYRISSLPLHT